MLAAFIALVLCCAASRLPFIKASTFTAPLHGAGCPQRCTHTHLFAWARRCMVSVTQSGSSGLHATLVMWAVLNAIWLLVPALRWDWSATPYWADEPLVPTVLSWTYGLGVITCWPALMNLGLAMLTVQDAAWAVLYLLAWGAVWADLYLGYSYRYLACPCPCTVCTLRGLHLPVSAG